jgi:bla regulator protein BlaR1
MTLPALANHLWQSTLLAALAGLLTLALRKQSARVRYWMWFAASIKFLVPFSFLFALGSHLAWRHVLAATPTLRFAIDVVSGTAPASIFSNLSRLGPALFAVWLGGFLVVLATWCVQWRKMLAAARQGLVISTGREVEALRRVESRSGGMKTEIRLSHASVEPGVFGIVHPVLLWPAGISDRLDDAQLEAILAHELEHVRRRDNLTAAIHMWVETIFWFHPLVWWLGARLVEERERACDERVLDSGSARQTYAEGVLKVCEFCLSSPLVCMAGVAGGDLKKRMVYIMTERTLHPLDFSRKLLLGVAGLAAVAAPIAFGLINATPSRAGEPAAIAASPQSENPGDTQVSSTEMNSRVVKKVNPEYPEAARKAGIQGAVVLGAIIGKTGDVENLQIVSGHPQLAPAAIEAVKQWKYKPYLKNGEPTEVKTQITVNFSLAK